MNETPKKLKIGLVIDCFFPMVDGVVIVVDNYAKQLSEYADVTVFTAGNKISKTIEHPYKVVYCKEVKFPGFDYPIPLPKLDPAFCKTLRDADLDVIHIHSPFMIGKYAAHVAKAHGIPLIGTVHSQYYQDLYKATHNKRLARLLLKNHIVSVYDLCDQCLAVNKSIQNLAVEDYGIRAPVAVANNGTDLSLLKNYDEARREMNQLYGLGEDERLLLFVGRLNRIKNIFFLVDAFERLLRTEKNYRLMFVGVGQDEEALRRRIRRLGIADKVIFTGKISSREDMEKHFARADLFTFPSLYDASSLVQIEAASQKTPALLLQGARTACTVTDGVDGYLSPADIDAYAAKIREIFADPERHARISEAAERDLAVSWQQTVGESYALYRRLSDEKRHSAPAQTPEKIHETGTV